MYTRPSIFKSFPQLIVAESTRLGGVSPAPYESLNLGAFTKDSLENVVTNRNRLFAALDFNPNNLVESHQVHADKILIAESPGQYEGYDALITNKKKLFLAITVADCVPILIYDAKRKAMAAIHSGWKGTTLKIVSKTLIALQKHYQSQPKDCYAYIGTCIDECSFEVDADVANHFSEDYKRWDETLEKYFIDLKKANKALLLEAGLPTKQIEISPYSTVLNNDRYFSYRKEGGTTGRLLGLIGLKSK